MSGVASIADYRRAYPEAKAALAGHPDLRVLGVGARAPAGGGRSAPCFVAAVERKGEPKGPLIGPTLTLPSGVYDVDVREAPEESLVLANGRFDGGDTLTVRTAAGRTGTVAVVAAAEDDDDLYALTCSHVAARPETRNTTSDVEAKIGGRSVVIGRVAHHTVLSQGGGAVADVALVRLNADGRAAADTFRLDTVRAPVAGSLPMSAAPAGGGERPHFYVARERGVPRVFECSRFAEIPSVVMRDGQTKLRIPFGRAFHFTVGGSGVRAGHSGALVVRERADGKLAAVGLLFAGRGGVGYAFSWTEVESALRGFGVRLR